MTFFKACQLTGSEKHSKTMYFCSGGNLPTLVTGPTNSYHPGKPVHFRISDLSGSVYWCIIFVDIIRNLLIVTRFLINTPYQVLSSTSALVSHVASVLIFGSIVCDVNDFSNDTHFHVLRHLVPFVSGS